MITGICMVLFAAISGEKVQVNVDAKKFAHLVYKFKKKKSSCFKELYANLVWPGGLQYENSGGLQYENPLEKGVIKFIHNYPTIYSTIIKHKRQ